VSARRLPERKTSPTQNEGIAQHVVRHAMKDFQLTIEELYSKIENRLSAKLLPQGFLPHAQVSTRGDFGSRYTEWRNESDKFAVRLTWDAIKSWFLFEESPYNDAYDPISWIDIVLVPVDKSKVTDLDYASSVIDDLVNEVE